MAPRTGRTFRGLPGGFDGMVLLFILRVLVDLDGLRVVGDAKGVPEPWILRTLGCEFAGALPLASSPAFLQMLRRRLKALTTIEPKLPCSEPLTQNLEWLGQTLSLSPVERDIVIFLALAHHASALGKLLEKFGSLRTHEVHGLIAGALGRPVAEVTTALLHSSKLVRSGLVWSELRNKWNAEAKVGLLSGIPDQLTLQHHNDPTEIFLSNFRRCAPATLDLSAFPHLAPDLGILEAYMGESLRSGRRGVNILIYGRPGTGKTQLARAMAAKLGSPMFEVATEDRYGEVHRPEARFGAYQLAQGLLGGNPRPLILFDEIEDVFSPVGGEEGRALLENRSGRKGWINNLLEGNGIPTFWITNCIGALDPAYKRRFDFVLEVGVPPRSVRVKIVEHHTSDLPMSTDWRFRIAEHEALTPADVERAARVTRAVLTGSDASDAEIVMERLLGNSMEAMGISRRPRASAENLTPYRLDLLNADRDLGILCRGITEMGAGRLCLYGPSGTGKTAFGHHLARVTDRPLHLHRASDLLGSYLGETEAAMAQMFRRAEDEGAVLLLDEADSFLQDRSMAARSWEVSQVNEMLTQLETFPGIFVASTNLMDHLDPAVLRRFDAKVRFDFLVPAQRVSMFTDACEALGVIPTGKAIEGLKRLNQLTPGDFAAVLRQGRFDPIASGDVLIERLAAECRLKGGAPRRSVGF